MSHGKLNTTTDSHDHVDRNMTETQRENSTYLCARIIENANHAYRHELVDTSSQSLSAQSKHKRNLLLPRHGNDII